MGKKFVEGKGYEVTSDGATTPPALRNHASPAAAAKITRKQVEEFAKKSGLVLITESDLQANVDRIAELEQEVLELEKRIADADAALDDKDTTKGEKTEKGAKSGKGKAAKEATDTEGDKPVASAETIGACESLEELTVLMVDVEDQELLDLADLRAEELKG